MPLPGVLRGALRKALARDQPEREVTRSEDEWRAALTPAQYRILRRRGTERPGSGPHLQRRAGGAYACAGCGALLFDAATQFDSGTGWPSFADARDAVETQRDWTLGIPRTEVLCRSCGGHLGHVFGDGPQPTGQRYCINGTALTYES